MLKIARMVIPAGSLQFRAKSCLQINPKSNWSVKDVDTMMMLQCRFDRSPTFFDPRADWPVARSLISLEPYPWSSGDSIQHQRLSAGQKTPPYQLRHGAGFSTRVLRHAAWLNSRYSVIRRATPHELAFGRAFNGELCEFGQCVFAYMVPNTKASARWKRMIFLGTAETQNSYVLFDRQAILMSTSVRRISTIWHNHIAYFVHCRCFSWQFRAGFGLRVLPTMRKAVPSALRCHWLPSKEHLS